MLNLPPMPPDPEISAFLMTVDDAVNFAAEGQLADGYAVLVAGTGAKRLRGRAEEAREAGEPWEPSAWLVVLVGLQGYDIGDARRRRDRYA